MLTYLKFCRQIKPKMTKDSAKILLEEYTKLRANDVTSKKTSYRITVRQLESIIRLSEALAKVHADDLIRGDYVREASRLLSKSIIPIKKEDIEVDEAQDTFNKIQNDRRRDGALNIDSTPDAVMEDNNNARPASPVKIQLSFDEYEKIGKQLIYFIKQKERQLGDNFDGIQQKELVGLYLKDIENQITGTESLMHWAKKLSSVIQRLITKEGVICVLNNTASRDERTLALNINIDPENIAVAN